ncbi:MAG: DUF1003 domain-containing protein [Gemmatimonadaceae bacterium]
MTTPSNDVSEERGTRTARERTHPILERNIRALAELSAAQLRPKSGGDRLAMAVSRFAGSMRSVYLHAVVFGLWAALDLGWFPGGPRLDPQLVGLNTVATVEAIFLATFVLIAQNRMSANEETRNHLDVQVSLLTEQETTHILRLVAAIGEKMELAEAADPEIKQLLRKVEAQEMIDQIEVHIDASDFRRV